MDLYLNVQSEDRWNVISRVGTYVPKHDVEYLISQLEKRENEQTSFMQDLSGMSLFMD